MKGENVGRENLEADEIVEEDDDDDDDEMEAEAVAAERVELFAGVSCEISSSVGS